MSANKCLIVFLLASCLIATVVGGRSVLRRQERSPQHGSIVLDAGKDQTGRHAGVQYNHNIYTSNDGRGTIDAYANANRNFDYNRNDFQGGIQGKWTF